ncbi:MAG: flagellar motor switch protein FliN [Candidatus Helarchaeota archaeon]|nr:flagellar motor switch protein FliN [Candidatus Helarchaeota archaeon]
MPESENAKFESFTDEKKETKKEDTVGKLGDIYIPVSIELARTRLFVKEILELEKGSIIEFEKLAGETVDLLVNDKKFAEGEVVVIDEHFGIRITNLVTTIEVELESR